MTNLKNFYLSKNILKLYHLPLLERILSLHSAVVFVFLPVFVLFVAPFSWRTLFFLLVSLLFGVLTFFNVFKAYICLDLNRELLIIRDPFGFSQKTVPLRLVQQLRFSDGLGDGKAFTIDIVYDGYVEKIKSWGSGYGANLVLFNRYSRQKKRLLKFTQECNEILEKNRPTQTTLNP